MTDADLREKAEAADRMEKGLRSIMRSLGDEKIQDDVVWYDDFITMFDYCAGVLGDRLSQDDYNALLNGADEALQYRSTTMDELTALRAKVKRQDKTLSTALERLAQISAGQINQTYTSPAALLAWAQEVAFVGFKEGRAAQEASE